jgi:hypothetical protein
LVVVEAAAVVGDVLVLLDLELPRLPVYMASPIARATATITTGMTRVRWRRFFCSC